MDYDASASVYDAIYKTMGKDYRLEASAVARIFKEYTEHHYGTKCLLDVACGTGRHLEFFKPWFAHVEGLDHSEAMLAVARQRLPDVTFHHGSMTSILLNPLNPEHEPQFDLVTCLFSAIGHMHEPNMLVSAIAEMADHVKPGGVLIIEPWLTPEKFDPERGDGAVFVDWRDLKVARFSTTTLKGKVTKLRLDHMVKYPGKLPETFTEEYLLGMWTEDDFRRAFRKTGMEVEFRPEGISKNGRGVYVAIKPA